MVQCTAQNWMQKTRWWYLERQKSYGSKCSTAVPILWKATSTFVVFESWKSLNINRFWIWNLEMVQCTAQNWMQKTRWWYLERQKSFGSKCSTVVPILWKATSTFVVFESWKSLNINRFWIWNLEMVQCTTQNWMQKTRWWYLERQKSYGSKCSTAVPILWKATSTFHSIWELKIAKY